MRPAVMPSVLCPYVRDWDTGETISAWLCVSRCLACAYMKRMLIDDEIEVDCAAPS